MEGAAPNGACGVLTCQPTWPTCQPTCALSSLHGPCVDHGMTHPMAKHVPPRVLAPLLHEGAGVPCHMIHMGSSFPA
jgi:hypothetical protein